MSRDLGMLTQGCLEEHPNLCPNALLSVRMGSGGRERKRVLNGRGMLLQTLESFSFELWNSSGLKFSCSENCRRGGLWNNVLQAVWKLLVHAVTGCGSDPAYAVCRGFEPPLGGPLDVDVPPRKPTSWAQSPQIRRRYLLWVNQCENNMAGKAKCRINV